MLLKVGVLGSGNFGGQVANVAVSCGYPAVAINASEQDLELLNPDVIPYLIGDGKGTGKSGDIAKEFLLSHLGFLKEKDFTNFIDNNDVIIMAGSSGGGFGSNTIPTLTQILMELYPEKLFIVLTVLPDENETYTAQYNSQQFMLAVTELNIPYIIYDNDKFKTLSPSESSEKIISNIRIDLQVLAGEYIRTTNIGGIDSRDLLTCLSVPGRMMIDIITPFDELDLVDGSIVKTIRAHIDTNGHAVMVDNKLIMASAIMYNINNDVNEYASVVKSELQETFGTHVTDYRNEAVDQDGDTFICVVLSGLDLPATRIDRIISRINKIDSELSGAKKAPTKLGKVESKHRLTAKKFSGTVSEMPVENKSNVDDIIKKFSSGRMPEPPKIPKANKNTMYGKLMNSDKVDLEESSEE